MTAIHAFGALTLAEKLQLIGGLWEEVKRNILLRHAK